MSKLIRLSTIAAVAALIATGPAFAHAHLKSAVPVPGSTVAAAPTEIDLTFSEGVNLKFTGIAVSGPKKEAVKTGEAMLMDGDTMLMVPVQGALAAGTYKVDWHALSTDGHKTNGSFTFTVKP
jgi:methionine-rich copper-binding protein CopC